MGVKNDNWKKFMDKIKKNGVKNFYIAPEMVVNVVMPDSSVVRYETRSSDEAMKVIEAVMLIKKNIL